MTDDRLDMIRDHAGRGLLALSADDTVEAGQALAAIRQLSGCDCCREPKIELPGPVVTHP